MVRGRLLDLSRSLGRTKGANAPPPLPTVYQSLADCRYRVCFRRGQISMVAGAAGSGKTVFAQWLAVKAGVPTLYFSADSDEETMAVRGAALVTGQRQDVIRQATGDELDWYASELHDHTQHVAWDYEQDHTPDSIEQAVKAFGMVYGQWPALIVFDVLMSYQLGDGSWAAMNEFILQCKALCSSTGAHVLILHHTSGAYTDRTEAPPRSAIMNKVDQFPSLIITIGREGSTWNLGVVKNRTGPADPKATDPQNLYVNLETVQVWAHPTLGGVGF